MSFDGFLGVLFLSNLRIGGQVLQFNLLTLIIRFVIPILITYFAIKLTMLLLNRLLEKTKFSEDIKKRIFRWIRIIFRIFLLILILMFTGRLFGAETINYIRSIFRFLNEPFYQSGSTKISVITLIMAVPVFYLAGWIARVVRRFLESTLLDRLSLDPSKKFSISNLLRYIVMALVIILGFSIIGINLSSLAVLFGVLGIGVGFGLQGMVANFFAGILIIISRPIKEGDRILAGNIEGTVMQIRLNSTIVSTLHHETIIVPNSKMVDSSVHNYSYEDRRIIQVNRVQVHYKSDLDRVVVVLEEIGKENPYSLPHPPPKVRVENFDSSGITMSLWVWIHEVEDKYNSNSWTNLAIWRKFREENITIPYTQIDMHIIGENQIEKS
jgi:potassium-dependent mechanosensitive channel